MSKPETQSLSAGPGFSGLRARAKSGVETGVETGVDSGVDSGTGSGARRETQAAAAPGSAASASTDTSAAKSAATLAAASSATSRRLQQHLLSRIDEDGGWLAFDEFMAMALYEPGLGYYARGDRLFGLGPQSGSDFVTAPELSPLFGAVLARQVAQALDAAGADEVWEFGAGSGALAQQLLQALGPRVKRYTIVEVSAALQAQQARRLQAWASQVRWLEHWPHAQEPGITGVVVGNEVLDAMPVKLLHLDGHSWQERGVGRNRSATDSAFEWQDRPTMLRPPGQPDDPLQGTLPGGTVTEIHPQAEAFVRTLASQLQRGAIFLIDYGFPEHEYYHPQRMGGTLMCHRLHRSDSEPLHDVGDKDITAHLNFSSLALSAQDAGLQVLGYTSQAHFLINCGLLDLLQGADPRTLAHAQKLVTEHEMGELFKVLGLARGLQSPHTLSAAMGFAVGDRSHTL